MLDKNNIYFIMVYVMEIEYLYDLFDVYFIKTNGNKYFKLIIKKIDNFNHICFIEEVIQFTLKDLGSFS